MSDKIIPLSGEWELIGYHNNEKLELSAFVPGYVHKDLLNNNIIKDIYWRKNADEYKWVEVWNWKYTKKFFVNEMEGNTWIEFEGIDTYAKIYLNGILLGSAKNMFLKYSFDVSGALKYGENVLEAEFEPISKAIEHKSFSDYPAAFGTPERVHIRRMQCTFGWDWVERFISYGIWKNVNLIYKDIVQINDVYVYTQLIDSLGAVLKVNIELDSKFAMNYHLALKVFDSDDNEVFSESRLANSSSLETYMCIPEPRLWWPCGYGKQDLYKLKTILTNNDGLIINEKETVFGIRTVRFLETADKESSIEQEISNKLKYRFENYNDKSEHGKSFAVVVNGKPIFCQGANWVPVEPFPSIDCIARYENLIKLAADGGINFLRCWGGGIYEHEEFWNLCNKYGIMVCQDFLMACAKYPEDDSEFIENIKEEVVNSVKTLRNNPCLLWWNGNNENGAESDYDAETYNGKKLSIDICKPIVENLDPSRRFFVSSPYGGRPQMNMINGTTHYTEALIDIINYIRYDDMKNWKSYFSSLLSRFCAEFAVFGMPEYHTVMKFMTENDLADKNDEILEYHTRNHPAFTDFTLFKSLEMLAEKLYGKAENKKEKLYYMAYAQYELIETLLASYRRNQWYSSGLLFWMYNDCWPASGWSIIDYYGIPKAGYYGFKKSANKALVSIFDDKVWVVNNSLSNQNIKLTIFCVSDASITIIDKNEFIINAGDSVIAANIPNGNIVAQIEGDSIFSRDLKMDIQVDAKVEIKNVDTINKTITVFSNNIAKGVHIEGEAVFDDNYFFLIPNEEKIIKYKPIGKEKFTVRCLWNE